MSFHKIYNLTFFVACYWLSFLEDREFIHLIKVCSLINQNKFEVLPSAWLNMNIKQASAKMKAMICGKTSRVKLAHHSSCQYNYSLDWLLVFCPLGWNDLRVKPGVLFIFFLMVPKLQLRDGKSCKQVNNRAWKGLGERLTECFALQMMMDKNCNSGLISFAEE